MGEKEDFKFESVISLLKLMIEDRVITVIILKYDIGSYSIIYIYMQQERETE